MKMREHRSCLCFHNPMEKETFLECLFKLGGHSDFFKDARWDPVPKKHFLNGQTFEELWPGQWKEHRRLLAKSGMVDSGLSPGTTKR
jgi:hypothetical protein